MTTDARDSRWLGVASRLVAVAALVAAVLVLSAYPFDDAFIHLRLARNLAFRGEPYFNLGERVMSGSSPLWLSWLSAIFRVTGHASAWAAIITECLVIAAVFFTAEGFLARPRFRSWMTLIAAFTVAALALPSAGGLMETPLAIALLFGGLWAYSSGRLVGAGVLLGLAGAARFEMLLPAIGALVLAPDWRARTRLFAGAGPVWLAQAAILYSAFGSVLPHTMTAKAIVYQVQRSDMLNMVPPELGKRVAAAMIFILGLSTTVEAVPLVPTAFGARDRSQMALLVLAAFPLGLLAIYAVEASFIFPWYWVLSLCPMALFAWSRVLERGSLSGVRNGVGVAADSVFSAIAVLALAWASVISVQAVLAGHLERSQWVMENARVRSYLTIGTVLAKRCPNAVVGAAEIGALGWTFSGKILDGVGLASPEVLAYHPLRVPEERATGVIGAIPGRAFATFRPDVVVSMDVFAGDFVSKAAVLPGLSDYVVWWKEPVFAAGLARSLPETLWGSRWTVVFARAGRCGPTVGLARP